jgi:2-dehydropantoate 2-reductase
MKILVMGTGGIGGYYGARLLESGANVFFVARGPHLRALQTNGLQLKSVNGDFYAPQVQASANPTDAGPVDVVMQCTKSWDLEEAAMMLKPVVHKTTVIIPFQNGIDTIDRLAKHFDRQHLAGGIAYGVVKIAAPGIIDHTSKDVHKLIFGAFPNYPEKTLRNFFELCRKTKFDVVWSESIEVDLWKKFLFICAYSGITSLIRKPIGPIVADADTYDLYKRCMLEVQSIAKAKGILLGNSVVEEWLEFSRALGETATSSMQRDLENGYRLELETLNGSASRLGKELNIPTPINDFIYTSLKLHARGLN